MSQEKHALQNEVRTSRHTLEEALEQKLKLRTLTDLQHKLDLAQREFGALGTHIKATSIRRGAIRDWVNEKPLEAIFVAFAAGLVLGASPFK